MSVLKVTLAADDRTLLATFDPEGLMVRWDPQALDWTTGNPMFSLAEYPLKRRLDLLLLDGLIECLPDGDKPTWKVSITEQGRAAIR